MADKELPCGCKINQEALAAAEVLYCECGDPVCEKHGDWVAENLIIKCAGCVAEEKRLEADLDAVAELAKMAGENPIVEKIKRCDEIAKGDGE